MRKRAKARKSSRGSSKRTAGLALKPGGIEDHPTGSKFKGKLKTPGWLPDKTEYDEESVFLEEAIFRHQERGLAAFPPPNHFGLPWDEPNPPPAFEEPQDNDPARWKTFNQWILGGSFTQKQNDAFDVLLEDILKRVRKYNAALYWMRRLHFHENADPNKILTKPPRNPNGDQDYGKEPKDWNFDKLVPVAQANWKTAITELHGILTNGKPPFKHLLGDVVRVNDYIISIRVIAQDKAWPDQLGGSSSSHISISSAFSSP